MPPGPRRQPDLPDLRVSKSARFLLDELTVWGPESPTLTLPPGRLVNELDHILETMRP